MGIYEITLKNLEDSNFAGLGLGAAAAAAKAKRIHQRIIFRLCNYFNNILFPHFEAINEGEIGETNSKIPDVTIWSLDEDLKEQKPFIAIEITTNEFEQGNKDKIKELFLNYPTLQECFIFTYDTWTHGHWQRFTRTSEEQTDKSEFISKIIGFDCYLNKPIKDIAHLIGIKIHKRTRKK